MSGHVKYRKLVADQLEPDFEGTLSQWAEGKETPQSVMLPTFQISESPWLRDPLDALGDYEVSHVTFRGAAGIAKSLVGEIWASRFALEETGLFYYVCQEDEAAKDVVEDRFMPFMTANRVLAKIIPIDRSKKRTAKLQFPGTTFYALGANKNNARSKRVKGLLRDECHLWKPGMMSAFKKRVIGVTGSKICDLSTGSVAGDEFDEEYEAGTKEVWHVLCPDCKQPQAMENRQLKFERSERTISPGGGFRMAAIRASVYYECRHCEKHWHDTPETRRWLSDTGHYVATNPTANPAHRSFHVNALAVHWIAWADLVEEWIVANRAAKAGATGLLQNYIMERLAEAWDESPREENPEAVTKRQGDYPMGVLPGQWPDGWQELTRFLDLDRQDDHLFAVCRAYSADGAARLVWAGGGREGPRKLQSYEEAEDLRQRLGVEPLRTFIDCAHFTKEVQQRCVQYGWQAFWGSDLKSWSHDMKSPFHPRVVAQRAGRPFQHISESPVRLPFSPPQLGHASIGLKGRMQTCTYYLWSNPAVKDFWHFLWNGGSETSSYTVANDTPPEHAAQTSVERKVRRYSKATQRLEWVYTHGKKPNHLCDCEQMSLVSAMMDDRIALAPPPQKADAKPEPAAA